MELFLEKRFHFVKVEPLFSLIIMFEEKMVPLTKGAIIFYWEGGRLFAGGGPEFFGLVKGGTSFLEWVKGEDQNFFRVTEGGQNFFCACRVLWSAVGLTHVLRCRLVMGCTT